MMARTATVAIIAGFLSAANSAGGVPTVWTGPAATITQDDPPHWDQPQNQDRLTGSVWLTRQMTLGLFNHQTETQYIASSPADTEWAYGSAAQWSSLAFLPWAEWNGHRAVDMVGKDAVLHLISNDIYMDIKFLSWGSGGAGGFAYQRSTPAASSSILRWNGGAGGNDHWTAAANWSGALAVPGTQLWFLPLAAGGHASNRNDFTLGVFGSIVFTAGAPSYNLQGNPIRLSGPVANLSTDHQAISLRMELVSGGGLFDTGAQNVTVSGDLSGNSPLTKTGDGVLVLSGTNSYMGGTVASAGILEIHTATALPSGRSLTIGGEGTVVLRSGLRSSTASAAAVPEPSTLALLGIGAVGALVCGWRRNRASG